MLIKAKELKGYQLDSTDGTIGSAREFHFDDHYWSIRYLVAKTDGWLGDRKVLLSHYSVAAIDPDEYSRAPLTLHKAIELLLLSDTLSNGNQSVRDNRDLLARVATPHKQALPSYECPAFNSAFAVATN